MSRAAPAWQDVRQAIRQAVQGESVSIVVLIVIVKYGVMSNENVLIMHSLTTMSRSGRFVKVRLMFWEEEKR